MRRMFKSKIHRATVTQADLHYEGSVTVDRNLLDAADILPFEMVKIWNVTNGERIEIRGFGSFSLHYRAPRMGRNPKTGEAVALPGKHVPHFKPGKALRERVDYPKN